MGATQTDWSIISQGLLISVVGYLVVMLALTGLYFVFRYLPRILKWQIRLRLRRMGKKIPENGDAADISADDTAAIATALYLYFNEAHDEENMNMTIERIDKRYSPWSSKIFGMMSKQPKKL